VSEKKRKVLYLIFKILSIIVSLAFPIWAICEKFPIWGNVYGAPKTAGVGILLVCIVALIIFRKTVVNYVKEKTKITHAPPVFFWAVMIVIGHVLEYLNNFIRDLTTIFWMGLIGCAIGTLLTYIAEKKYGKKEENNG
jgi:lipid-A-disaccharide synthase-like uncharacterized protein